MSPPEKTSRIYALVSDFLTRNDQSRPTFKFGRPSDQSCLADRLESIPSCNQRVRVLLGAVYPNLVLIAVGKSLLNLRIQQRGNLEERRDRIILCPDSEFERAVE
jgi:hypothetical protein